MAGTLRVKFVIIVMINTVLESSPSINLYEPG